MERPPAWSPPKGDPLPLTTGRLTLDRYRDTDAPALHLAISGGREALARWMPWPAQGHADEAETLDWIRQVAKEHTYAHPENLPLGVFHPETRDVLGGSGLHQIQAEARQAEVGYWVRPDLQGQGLCTEATRALVDCALTSLGFRRLVLRCRADNIASRRVAEKVGFRLERQEIESRWVEGLGWQDELGFALLAHEWELPRGR